MSLEATHRVPHEVAGLRSCSVHPYRRCPPSRSFLESGLVLLKDTVPPGIGVSLKPELVANRPEVRNDQLGLLLWSQWLTGTSSQQDKKTNQDSHTASHVRFLDYSLPTRPLYPTPGFERVASPRLFHLQAGAISSRATVQLAQRSRAADVQSPPLSLGVGAETFRSSTVRLENPLGVFGGRSVEALSRARNEKRRHAATSLGSIEARQLANGAQESDLQHRCASSAQSFSPI